MWSRRRLPAPLVLLLALAPAGCGGSDKVTVKGRVTLDNVPLEKGTIDFLPADGQGPTAGGEVRDGAFTVAVPPGPKVVRINASRVIDRRRMYEAPDSPLVDISGESKIPARYNTASELREDIRPGQKELVYDLKGK